MSPSRIVAAASLCAALSVLACAAAVAATRENPKCTPNPVFEKFPNAIYHSCQRSRFMKLDIAVARDPARPAGPRDSVAKEGEYWYYFDHVNPDANKARPSRIEILRNYEAALRQAGGTLLHTDGDRALTYRIERPSGEYWGQVGCGAGSAAACTHIQHKIVRVAAMEQSVVVSAERIREAMGDAGKVVFYGIYFDTDQAVVKPESRPTLEQMAKYLEDNAAARVFIVGHTDNQGALEHNRRLSRDRAAAVTAALAGTHGIAASRLQSDGVGPLAPVAANDSEAGRAKNRRVEMVLR